MRWNAALTSLETWHELRQASHINQAALIALIQTINSYKHQSSGWFVLALLINNWINDKLSMHQHFLSGIHANSIAHK
ncbi:hypothetical protein SE18_01835 [Herpetosiphon geysericola]|uniref:Uncharacterized protein n=1 Tax=Herpetosiphon geysericola TaxID=70996 RepID=A0A0P6Y1G5_9CHLR|nr:hypothetical protein SE18_01835 [Herpetosiphon geysericola]